MPPPEPILSKKKVSSEIVNTGLNICFKRAYAFSQHPDSGGEDLGPIPSSFVPQSSVVPSLDFMPVTQATKRMDLSEMICEDMQRIVYSRYGLEYLTNIMRGYRDEDGQPDGLLDVGSFQIDLDNLIYQKQKALN